VALLCAFCGYSSSYFSSRIEATAMAHVFTIANGRIIRFLDFVDTAQIADA
jgi:hypothetical protein